jgi:hypothetical protein
MGRVADYASTLSPDERERFADLIAECTQREAAIAGSAARAQAAVERYAAERREFGQAIAELKALSIDLKESIGRLYLSSVPAKGRVS